MTILGFLLILKKTADKRSCQEAHLTLVPRMAEGELIVSKSIVLCSKASESIPHWSWCPFLLVMSHNFV